MLKNIIFCSGAGHSISSRAVADHSMEYFWYFKIVQCPLYVGCPGPTIIISCIHHDSTTNDNYCTTVLVHQMIKHFVIGHLTILNYQNYSIESSLSEQNKITNNFRARISEFRWSDSDHIKISSSLIFIFVSLKNNK